LVSELKSCHKKNFRNFFLDANSFLHKIFSFHKNLAANLLTQKIPQNSSLHHNFFKTLDLLFFSLFASKENYGLLFIFPEQQPRKPSPSPEQPRRQIQSPIPRIHFVVIFLTIAASVFSLHHLRLLIRSHYFPTIHLTVIVMPSLSSSSSPRRRVHIACDHHPRHRSPRRRYSMQPRLVLNPSHRVWGEGESVFRVQIQFEFHPTKPDPFIKVGFKVIGSDHLILDPIWTRFISIGFKRPGLTKSAWPSHFRLNSIVSSSVSRLGSAQWVDSVSQLSQQQQISNPNHVSRPFRVRFELYSKH